MKIILSKHVKSMLLLIFTTVALTSCKKDKPTEKTEGPQIISIQPKNPQTGDMVTITGTGFGATATDVKLTIGRIEVSVSSVTETEIKFAIPANLTSGELVLAIKGMVATNKDAQGTTINITPKAVTLPTFTAMTPGSGKTGDVITLTGTNFSTLLSDNKVFFATTTGGTVVLATIKTATATTLTVEVPANAITGSVLISVKSVNAIPAAGFNTTFTINNTTGGGTTTVDYINNLSGNLKFSKIATAGRDIGAMWLDKAKNLLYYSDFVYPGVAGNTVYKLDPNGGTPVVLTTDARITSVRNITTDAAGNVYVLRYAETSLVFSIYKISPDGATVTEIIKSFEPVGVFCFFINSNNELCLRPDLKISASGTKITTGPKLNGLAFDRGAFYSGNTSYLVQCPDNNNAASNAKFIKWSMADNAITDADFTLKSLFNADDASAFSGSNKIPQLRFAVDDSDNLYAIMEHSYISGSTSKTWMVRKTKNGSGTSALLGTFLIKFPAIDLPDYSAAVEFIADATGNLYFKANSKDIIRITQ